jgi:hypothetical protein
LNAFVLLPGLGLLSAADQPVAAEQLLFQATLLLQQGLPLQAAPRLVTLPSRSCDNIYNISSSFQKPGAAMGYGQKSDFTKDLTASPPASKYDIKTIFDKNKTSRKGFSLYLSR